MRRPRIATRRPTVSITAIQEKIEQSTTVAATGGEHACSNSTTTTQSIEDSHNNNSNKEEQRQTHQLVTDTIIETRVDHTLASQ